MYEKISFYWIINESISINNKANRKILTQGYIDFIYDKTPSITFNKNFQIKSIKKEKQIKRKWSEKEKKLFQEGIDKFGEKSK